MSRAKTLRFIAALSLLFTLLVVSVCAQDASQVLRLSVGFNTLKNTVPMSDEQKKQLAEIEAKAQKANGEKRYGDALRYLNQGMALMRKQPWTPANALSTALQMKSSRVIADPGDAVRLTVTQSFALEDPLTGKLGGSVTIAPARSKDAAQELKSLSDLGTDFTAKALEVEAKLPALEDVVPDREERFRDRGSFGERHRVGLPDAADGRCNRVFGVAATRDEREHRVANRNPLDAFAERRNNARDFKTGKLGMSFRRRIIPLPLQHIRPIDTCRCNFDQDFACARSRYGNVAKLQNVRSAFSFDDNGFHGGRQAHPLISQM